MTEILGYALANISFLTTAAFTIERLYVICQPMKKTRTLISVVGVSVIWVGSIVIYFPSIFDENLLIFNPETGTLDWDCQYAEFSIWATVALSNTIILPSNILLVTRLHREKQTRRFFFFSKT